MTKEEIKKKELYIINAQLLGCIGYIISLFISIIIILNEKKIANGEEPFLTAEEAEMLTILNKLFIILLIIFFFYIAYQSYQLKILTKQDTSNLSLQIIGSILSFIVALIGLYTVTNSNDASIIKQTANQNPFL
ncbi:MAG: hypothetical protein RSA48_03740 [Bacilli bacterium]